MPRNETPESEALRLLREAREHLPTCRPSLASGPYCPLCGAIDFCGEITHAATCLSVRIDALLAQRAEGEATHCKGCRCNLLGCGKPCAMPDCRCEQTCVLAVGHRDACQFPGPMVKTPAPPAAESSVRKQLREHATQPCECERIQQATGAKWACGPCKARAAVARIDAPPAAKCGVVLSDMGQSCQLDFGHEPKAPGGCRWSMFAPSAGGSVPLNLFAGPQFAHVGTPAQPRPFAVGDRVRCVDEAGTRGTGVDKDATYTVQSVLGEQVILSEGVGEWHASRFVLAPAETATATDHFAGCPHVAIPVMRAPCRCPYAPPAHSKRKP